MEWEKRICSQAGGMSIVPFLFGTRGKWPETLIPPSVAAFIRISAATVDALFVFWDPFVHVAEEVHKVHDAVRAKRS